MIWQNRYEGRFFLLRGVSNVIEGFGGLELITLIEEKEDSVIFSVKEEEEEGFILFNMEEIKEFFEEIEQILLLDFDFGRQCCII